MPEGPQNVLAEILRHPLTWLFSGGGLSLLINHAFARRRAVAYAKQVDAGAETTLSAGAIAFANELRRDIDALQLRVAALETENRTLYRRVVEVEAENMTLKSRLSFLGAK